VRKKVILGILCGIVFVTAIYATINSQSHKEVLESFAESKTEESSTVSRIKETAETSPVATSAEVESVSEVVSVQERQESHAEEMESVYQQLDVGESITVFDTAGIENVDFELSGITEDTEMYFTGIYGEQFKPLMQEYLLSRGYTGVVSVRLSEEWEYKRSYAIMYFYVLIGDETEAVTIAFDMSCQAFSIDPQPVPTLGAAP